MFIAKLFLLPVFLKMLQKTHKPLWCAILYTLAIVTNVLLFEVAAKANWGQAVLETGLSFGLSYGWFVLLNDLEGSDAPYWTVLVLGLGLLLYL